MGCASLTPIGNGQALALNDIAELELASFRETMIQSVKNGKRLACLCADAKDNLWGVLASDAGKTLEVGYAPLRSKKYPSITLECPQAHLFEREIAEQWCIQPEGHPWLKPLRKPLVDDFYQVAGEEVHEVAVGPVHAGVIEPGHFRFQCHGEKVLHLEIALGYQHRGVEQRLLQGPHPLSLKHAETVSGDSSIAHSWAYCQALEGLAGVSVPRRSQYVRALALELERAANHTGDLGALSGDTGFLPTASYCGRIRGDWLNLTAEVCGSRLGRNWLRPGGVNLDLEPRHIPVFTNRLHRVWADTQDAIELLWGATSVSNRFVGTGVVDARQAREIGMVGVAARACGCDLDVRRDHAFGPYRENPLHVGLASSGGVHSRAWVRWVELQESYRYLSECLKVFTQSEVDESPGSLPDLAANHLCLSMVEGWRGEVLHLVMTDANARFSRYKIVDPSFHNWFGLALALREEQISDFPLCNKSFNLSYCGHDL